MGGSIENGRAKDQMGSRQIRYRIETFAVICALSPAVLSSTRLGYEDVMAKGLPNSIRASLERRVREEGLRELISSGAGTDLCSNDYLGVARSLSSELPVLLDDLRDVGATGSRLVSGSSVEHEELEIFLAQFHEAERALLFGSGYEANLGLLASLGGRHDTILYDELVHASMRDGIRLSIARSHSFMHNDLDDLRRKLDRSKGDRFVAVESLYSMDGDLAPLKALCDVCEEHEAYLIVDEAHATGIFGAKGEGLVQELGLAPRVFTRIHTFGKALGYRGACVVGGPELRDFLVNFARPFIYSTAPDLLSVRIIRRAYSQLECASKQRDAVWALIDDWRALAERYPEVEFIKGEGPIQGIVVPTNDGVVRAERMLRDEGFFVRAIRSPTVPVGRERLRVCLHSFNTKDHLVRLLEVLQSLSSGRYAA